MLCPCCGNPVTVGTTGCACGARFVGQPLDDAPIKVQRLGPVMTAILLLALVTTASLVFTKWLAPAGVVVIWAGRRALLLARRDPEGYGGYRIAAATLSLTLFATAVCAAVAIARIPEFLENRATRELAATRAEMHRVASILEEYKRLHGSYPRNMLEVSQVLNGALPADYWEKTIAYQSTSAIAETTTSRFGVGGLAPNNFELRSAGPDGIEGNDDDLIMSDGLFLTAVEARRLALPRKAPTR
jgi:hypothetical protein